MTVSTEAYMAQMINETLALGDKTLSSDAHFVIDGFENLTVLAKQFPWPVLTPEGEIETPAPMGIKIGQPQQINAFQRSPIAFMETRAGHIEKMIREINEKGGRFNARIYEGTRENPLRTARIFNCWVQMEPIDRDIENRAQIVLWSGTLFYHYTGEA